MKVIDGEMEEKKLLHARVVIVVVAFIAKVLC